jgi:hypothetical protein
LITTSEACIITVITLIFLECPVTGEVPFELTAAEVENQLSCDNFGQLNLLNLER